jgi:hypothetical protein
LHSQLSLNPYFKKNTSVINPEGYFGENQLQYVPRNKKQGGGYNPNEYMNKMEPKVFPNQKRDAKWVNYATQHDFAGRFPGETRTNRDIGLERSNRNTVPLVPNLVRPKELKRAQEGATRQDSLNAYNAAVELLQALQDQGYKIQTNPSEYSGEVDIKDFVRRMRGDFTPGEREAYDIYGNPPSTRSVITVSEDGSSDMRSYVEDDIYKFYGVLDRSEEDGVIRAREKTIGVINPSIPTGYYDRRIEPQGFMEAWSEDDVVELPYYDPIAVKPYDMLTEEEKAERLRKYGSEPKMRPVKKEVIKTVRAQQPTSELAPTPQPQRPAATGLRRMFPLPPPQNQIIATDNRQLQEMLFDERKKGRDAVRVMKADQQMKTGASPDYDVMWDEKRKQWIRRDIPQEEVDRYRKENRIFVTPKISF